MPKTSNTSLHGFTDSAQTTEGLLTRGQDPQKASQHKEAQHRQLRLLGEGCVFVLATKSSITTYITARLSSADHAFTLGGPSCHTHTHTLLVAPFLPFLHTCPSSPSCHIPLPHPLPPHTPPAITTCTHSSLTISATLLTHHFCHTPHSPFLPHSSLTISATLLTHHFCHTTHSPFLTHSSLTISDTLLTHHF